MSQEADNLDNAAALTMQLNESYVAAARRAATPEQTQNADGSWPSPECECGEKIPEARLALGRIRCVDCQRQLEKEKRR